MNNKKLFFITIIVLYVFLLWPGASYGIMPMDIEEAAPQEKITRSVQETEELPAQKVRKRPYVAQELPSGAAKSQPFNATKTNVFDSHQVLLTRKPLQSFLSLLFLSLIMYYCWKLWLKKKA